MATIKTSYDTEAAAITCTLASLATASARESTALDNRTNLYLDALVMLRVKTGSGTPAGDKSVYVYVAGTVDQATPVWPDTVTGSDAAITLNSPIQLRLLGTVFTPAATTTYTSGPWSVAERFGGTLPEKWSIVVYNQSGVTLDATESNHKKIYQGILATST